MKMTIIPCHIRGGVTGLQQQKGKSTYRLAGAQNSLCTYHSPFRPLTMALNELDRQGTTTNNATYASLVRRCGKEKALSDGRRVHAHISASGRDRNTFLANLLVQMYGKCGSVGDARSVFNKISRRDMFSWNFMIEVYAHNGHEVEALQLYKRMQMEGIEPNKFTFFPILSASASLRALEQGKLIHKCIVASGFTSDVAVRTALLNMYGKCGSLKDARDVFDVMHERDVISWTAMIGAYAQNGRGKEALQLFRQMDLEGIQPNSITFLSILEACASLASLENGRVIHERIVTCGFETDTAVRNALVTMYGKCGSLKDAQAVFDQMQGRDVISWNGMIAAYAENGYGQEALDLLKQMVLEGIKPNRITFLSILNTCARLSSIENGKAIHECIVACGFDLDVALRTALVNMYGKCGSLKDAEAVFNEMHERDLISWTAMITAYAQNGHGKEALELFEKMELGGVKPDRVTFLSILNACSHAGLLDVGRQHFVSMSGVYGITPSEEHYVCMNDLLGRVGCLDEAEDLILNMPIQPSAVAWTTLFGACRVHGDMERGARVAEHILELDPENASHYVLLSNMYAASGRWDDATKVREVMEGKGLMKKHGCCGFEAEGTIMQDIPYNLI